MTRTRALALFLAISVPSVAIGAKGDDLVEDVRTFFAGDGAGVEAAPTALLVQQARHDANEAIDFPRQAAAIRRALDGEPTAGATAELVERLGIVGDRSDVPRILELSEHPHQQVSMAAMNSLGRLGGAKAIRRLSTIARSEDSSINGNAVRALGLSSDPEAVEILEDLTRHADTWRRQQALDALALRGGARARRAIHKAFLTSPASDAWATAGAVATLGGPADRRLLVMAATTPHDPRADAAHWALATMSGPETDAILLELAESAPPSRRSTAISSLANVADDAAVELIMSFWDTSPNHRYDIITALGNSKAPSALDGLLTLLDDARPDTAHWFASALAARPEPTAREVLRVLADEEGPLGDAALAQLTTIGDKSATSRLLARFDEDGRLPPPETLTFLAVHGGDEGWQLIEEVLADGTANDRNYVVWALQARGDEDAATRLLDLVESGDSWTASSAMSALEGMGDFARDGLRGLLMKRLEDGQDFDAVASTLARLGGDEARDALVSRLNEGTTAERWSAMSALGQMDDPEARGALMALMDDEDASMRSTAISTLLWSGTQEVPAEILDKALADEDITVRTTAIGALANQPDGIERLLAFAEDEDPTVRSTAISTLGSSGDPRAEEVLIGALDDPEMSQSAMWSLQSMGSREGAAAIRDVAESSEDAAVRMSAIGMLGQDPSTEATEILSGHLLSDEPGEASAALYALQSKGNSSAAEAIAELLDEIADDEDDVDGLRWQAAQALQGIGGRVARERSDLLEEILGSADQGLMDMGDWGCGMDYFGP